MDADSLSIYARGCIFSSDKDWYHGELTRDEAEQALTALGYDCFLVRESRGALVLSLVHHVQMCHIIIEYDQSGYRLLGALLEPFEELQDLITWYRTNPISDDPPIILGLSCMKIYTSKQDTG